MGISPLQGRYTEYTQINIRALRVIRTHDLSVRACEGTSCLRPCGHCDRLYMLYWMVIITFLQYRISHFGTGSKFQTIYWILLYIRKVPISNNGNNTGHLYNSPGFHPGLVRGTYKSDRNEKLTIDTRGVCLDDTTEHMTQQSAQWPTFPPAALSDNGTCFNLGKGVAHVRTVTPNWDSKTQTGFKLRDFNPDYVKNIRADVLLIIYRKCMSIIISIHNILWHIVTLLGNDSVNTFPRSQHA
jgi:hypothetical protein